MILLLFATQGEEEEEGNVYVGTTSAGSSYAYYYRG